MYVDFWLHIDVCDHCNRAAEVVFIGRSVVGWAFRLNGSGEKRSFEDWDKYITDTFKKYPNSFIRNQYGTVYQNDELMNFIANRDRIGRIVFTQDCLDINGAEMVDGLLRVKRGANGDVVYDETCDVIFSDDKKSLFLYNQKDD